MKLSDFLLDVGRPVAYFPKLAQACGSAKAGILISQLSYWSGRGSDDDGWIYKTAEEITNETGLSYKEQLSARKHLVEIRAIQEHYDRFRHCMIFKVNFDVLNEIWDAFLQSKNIEGTTPKGTCPPDQTEGGTLPMGRCHHPKGKMASDQREDRTVPTESTHRLHREGPLKKKFKPDEKNGSQNSDENINVESPLAMAVRKVCGKRTLMLSPKDQQDLVYVLRGLQKEHATVAQVEEFGRKVKNHWIGFNSKTRRPQSPKIMQVLEFWYEILEIQETPQTPDELASIAERDAITEKYKKRGSGENHVH